jgi:hypothetical protein
MRAFTLARTTSEAINNLLAASSPEQLRILLPEEIATAELPPLDSMGLLPEDYGPLYALLPKKTNPYVGREPTGQVFMLHFNHCCNETSSSLADDVLRALNARIKYRRMESRKKRPPVRINVSRITDALINLGLSTLQERVTASEIVEGSPRSDAGKSQDKLPNRNGRKAAKI